MGGLKTMQKRGLIIGGKEVFTDSEFPVYNKYSGEVISYISSAEQKHVDHAIGTASETFKKDKLSPYQRYEILNKAANLMKERKEEFARTLVFEVGKTISEARVEVDRSIQVMILSSEEAKRIGGEVIPISSSPGNENKMGYYIRCPIGVICAITPFNLPLSLSCHKVGPAIASGNTVIWKPASETPLTAYLLLQVLTDAGLPSGYVNLICGSGSRVGKWLLADERIGKYTFTGSSEVGRRIKEQSGLRGVSLELGNNSPNIVHHDADLDLAAKMCTMRGYINAGQTCVSVQRIYVHKDVKDIFVNKLVSYTSKLKIGDPLDETTDIGPLINSKEADRIKEWINEAVAQGAKIAIGGEINGAFITPTILDNVENEMKVACQEIFGPVLTVMTYEDLDQAIDESNNTQYGLQSAIFTSNINTAMHAVKRLHTGGVIINDASTFRADLMPYGGIKDSGLGKEGPRFAVEQMTEVKMVVINL
jgi:acyl-CoA reductase-like NAD-dependent aldehyde dehydrogenase